jgi:hypothetical protein
MVGAGIQCGNTAWDGMMSEKPSMFVPRIEMCCKGTGRSVTSEAFATRE